MRRVLWTMADISVAVIAATAVGFAGYIIIETIKVAFS